MNSREESASVHNNAHDTLAECEKNSTVLSAGQRRELMLRLKKSIPDPRSALNFHNPFELLCAVVLSAQATDVSVNKITPGLFAAAPDARAMAALGEEKIARIIKSIGLWRAKSRNLAGLSSQLCEKYGGKVPQTYAELAALPGVGSKTAKVVLNVAFGQPCIAVDTHIFRVCCRTGLCPGKNAAAVEKKLPELIEDEFKLQAHHLLLLHGRHVCKARSPCCDGCVIASLCLTRRAQTGTEST